MAYATGSAADLPSLMTAIKDFALAEGWTIDKYVNSGTIGNNLLFMTKGACAVAFQAAVVTGIADWTTGANVPRTENRLRGALATSINTALNTYFGHPGSLVTTATDGDRIEINDLDGPFAAYHFFSDPSVSDYVHVVVQCGADRYQHFGFGNVDQGDFTHAGVGYLTGVSRPYWRTHSNAVTANTSNNYNKPGSHRSGFATRRIAVESTGSTIDYADATFAFHAPDALPAGWAAMHIQRDAYVARVANLLHFVPYNIIQGPRNEVVLQAPINAMVTYNNANNFSGVAAMFGVPAVLSRTGPNQNCYVGDIPNVRLLNMDGMAPGQELTFGGETWVVFPNLRQTGWGNAAVQGDQATSGHYGTAHKKVA